MRIFLTGATGLVGSHTAALLRTRGDAVVALVRRTSDRAHLDALGVQAVAGDLSDDPARLAAFMRGCDAVVHSAALVGQRGGVARFRRVNVEGTERLLQAAAAAGVDRFVHVSSIAVYGRLEPGEEATEDTWRGRDVPERMAYAWSKRAAEEAAWRLHDAGGIRLTTVRPGVIYGERDRWFTPWLARVVSLPLVPLPGAGDRTVPVVYAGNVARGILLALDREASVGRAYNLSADEPITLRALVEAFGGALGRRPRTVSVPAGLLASLAWAGNAVLRFLPGLRTVDLRLAARRVTEDNPFDSGRAARELGWTDLVPAAAALAHTARWWRERRNSRQMGSSVRGKERDELEGA